MNMKLFPVFALSLLLAGPVMTCQSLRAQETPGDPQAAAYRNSLAQEEVGKQSQKIQDALVNLLQDLSQNGASIKGSEEAKRLAGQLAVLNRDQISPLVEQLRKAGGASESAAQLLSDASKGQKQVQVNLKKLENGLSLRINLETVELRLRQITLRQAANLRQTRDIAASHKGDARLPRNLAQLFAICQSEQAGLKEEIGLILEGLAKMVAEVPESDRPGLAEALAEGKRLNITALASTAAEQTALASFPSCLESQSAFLDGLQSMRVKAREKMGVEDRVRELQEQFQQLARNQQRAADNTQTADASAARDILETQGGLSDQLVIMSKELSMIHAEAARFAQEAGASMDQARESLRGVPVLRNEIRKTVNQNQVAAVNSLQAAGDDLQKLLEKLVQAGDKSPQTIQDALNALAQLDKKVRTAMARQQLLDSRPVPADQLKLATETLGLQEEALPLVPSAAPYLGQAAGHMRQDRPKAYPALVLASKEIEKQMKALAEAQAEIDKLQAAADKLAQAQAAAQAAAQNLQQAKPDMAGAVQQTQQAEQALDQVEAPMAQQALDQAQQQLEASTMSAAQAQQQQASNANAQAQQAMQQAQQSLQQAMAQATASALGQPGPPQDAQMAGMQISFDADVSSFMGNSQRPSSVGKPPGALSPKDRDSISSLEKEKTPTEYLAMVQQYLKNLAEGTRPTTPMP
jgi:hypothetical protein